MIKQPLFAFSSPKSVVKLNSVTNFAQVFRIGFWSIKAIICGGTIFISPGNGLASTLCSQLFRESESLMYSSSLPLGVSIFAGNEAKISKIGIPQNLNAEYPFFSVIQSLESIGGSKGTGFHVGAGWILTNRHVYEGLAGVSSKKTRFEGMEKLGVGAKGREPFLVALPNPSEADTKAMNHASTLMSHGIRWDQILNYNDWALLYDPAIKNAMALEQFRNPGTLSPLEPLWVLGRPEAGNKGTIAGGNFLSRGENVSILEDIDLKGGFSGSPVVDRQGKVVGIIFGFHPILRKASMMNIDVILAKIKKLREAKLPNSKPGVVPLSSRFVDNHQSETLVFIHGNGESAASFTHIEKLLPKNYNYLFYDQRGSGQSFYSGVDFRLRTMVDDLDLLVKGLGIQKAHLVGHSFGARIAIAYASLHPKTVKSVISEDMDFIARDPRGEKSIDAFAESFQGLLRTYPSMPEAISALKAVFGNDQETLISVLQQTTYRQESGSGVTILSAPIGEFLWGSYANATDLGPAFLSYPGPVLFMKSSPTATAMSPAGISQILSLKPKAAIVNFPTAPHSIHGFQPAEFVNAVINFVSSP